MAETTLSDGKLGPKFTQIVDANGVKILGAQGAAVANGAAATAAAVATTGVTQTTPYGYASAAQGDAVAVAINALIVDVADLRTQLNAALARTRAHGLIAT